jgi:predicted MPP superfamily phosphohydrolase
MTLPTLSRRAFLGTALGATVAGIGAFAYVRVLEPHWLDIEQIPLRLPSLPAKLHGKRIVQLSDIHLSPYFAPDRLAHAVNEINRLAPDWVLLTGDFFSGGNNYAAGLVEPLRRLEPPAFAIYGNHDLSAGREILQRITGETSIDLLVNAAAPLADGLWIAGVDDGWTGYPDLRAAVREVPGDAVTLLMAHEPDYFDTVIKQDAPIAAQFSGHSHGGQVRVPTFGPGPDGNGSRALILPFGGRRYPIGLRQVGARQVYTNRGLGLWPMPYRFNCRPEITLFTLEASGPFADSPELETGAFQSTKRPSAPDPGQYA